MTKKKIIIAIDGFSSCGKSTLAKAIAKSLEITYVDSGAMYRAVALYLLLNDINIQNTSEIVNQLNQISIDFKFINGSSQTFLNGINVEDNIRTPEVAAIVSEVAQMPEVRTKLVSLQRKMGEKQSIVMDGRDIGSNVFPNADIKLFVTADSLIRAQRRLTELKNKNISVTLEQVLDNLKHRDHIDSTRKTNPLIRTKDSILIDNSYLSEEEQLNKAIGIIQNKINI